MLLPPRPLPPYSFVQATTEKQAGANAKLIEINRFRSKA
jgi:hypothetical protein